ncbi:hypothetical protein HY450_02100 [Candidatus Pacearchaeota archaeon]|nr:hypothetical protein [Candidatus Pacearchaeota archaeon]
MELEPIQFGVYVGGGIFASALILSVLYSVIKRDYSRSENEDLKKKSELEDRVDEIR